MKIIYFTFFFPILLGAQTELYFPPLSSDSWQMLSPDSLNWCPDKIEDFSTLLDDNLTKACIVLKDGKIVYENYFDGFKQDSSWIWYSAGKSLNAFLMGLAQEQGLLDIAQPSQTYLGQGWSSLDNNQEQAITVRHHMTMTTGLDYTVDEPFCTNPECLTYLNPPGSHWYYHNAPYSLCRDILESATDQNINTYTFQQLHQTIGMDGFWLRTGYNSHYFSTARSMARFGLLMLANGQWEGTAIMHDTTFFKNMIAPSQQLNPAYGYLWWLNGSQTYKLPSQDDIFDGPILPNAPQDLYAALGFAGQTLAVIPSENMVIVRLGAASLTELVAVSIIDEIVTAVLNLSCASATTALKESYVEYYPNPSNGNVHITTKQASIIDIISIDGQKVSHLDCLDQLDVTLDIEKGIYFLRVCDAKTGALISVEKLIISD